MITWIVGESGSGKTTLAKVLQKEYSGIILDGDALRQVWKLGFSTKDRREQNMRAAKLARLIEAQGYNVIVATICPGEELRKEVQLITDCRMIRL